MKSITVPAELSQLDAVLAFINEALENAGCPVKTSVAINIAAEEVFVNIANYAYDDRPGEATVGVSVDECAKVARLEFIDGGKPYNPLARKDPDIERSSQEREIGGLGVFMVKKMMDEVAYQYKDGRNVFSFCKALNP